MKNLTTLLFLAIILGTACAFACGIDPLPCIALALFAGAILSLTGIGEKNVFAITMQSFAGPTGDEDNIGGTGGTVYGAAVNTFTAAGITEPPSFTAGTTMASLATNADDMVFATGGRFWEFYCTENKGQLKYASQGDLDGRSYKPTLEIFYPGSKADILGFLRYAKNQKWIFLVPMADDTVHQIGTRKFQASFTGEWDSATNSSGVRGAMLKIETGVVSGPMLYEGAIPLTPAV